MRVALAGAVALCASTISALPAHAELASIPVDCAAGAATLSEPGRSYVLIGSCRRVLIDADNVSVSTIGRIGRLTVVDARARVMARSVATAVISGTRGRFRFTRLDVLSLPGSHDHVLVQKGSTRVSVTGVHNHVRVHRRRHS